MKPTVTLARSETPEGAQLTLVHHDRTHFLMLGGVQLMATNTSASEQLMADLSCLNLPPKARVLIGGLGFGFTLKRVLELCPPDAVVEVAELLPIIVEWNRTHLLEVNGHLLNDPRVVLKNQDVFDLLDGVAAHRYHVVLLDVDNSPDPMVQRGNARLYSRNGLRRIKGSMHPGGRIVFWSANRDDPFAKSVKEVFGKVECVAAKSYAKAKRACYTLFVSGKDKDDREAW